MFWLCCTEKAECLYLVGNVSRVRQAFLSEETYSHLYIARKWKRVTARYICHFRPDFGFKKHPLSCPLFPFLIIASIYSLGGKCRMQNFSYV